MLRQLHPKLTLLNRVFVALLLSVGLGVLSGIVGNLLQLDEKLVLAIIVLIVVLNGRFWFLADGPR